MDLPGRTEENHESPYPNLNRAPKYDFRAINGRECPECDHEILKFLHGAHLIS
jgi:hypothetical protein